MQVIVFQLHYIKSLIFYLPLHNSVFAAYIVVVLLELVTDDGHVMENTVRNPQRTNSIVCKHVIR